MKTRSSLAVAALCSLPLLAGSTLARSEEKPPATPEARATANLPPSLAAEKAAKEAIKAHVKESTDRFTIATPPPPPRPETRPPAPAANLPTSNLVWVAGHWAADNGEWKWVAGQWSVPATPTSVWIEARYDPKAKRWSPGYWQPDRPGGYEGELPPAKESAVSLPRIP